METVTETRYKNVNLGFIKFDIRSTNKFLCDGECWEFKPNSVSSENYRINQEFLTCHFKKDFLSKGLSGKISFTNGSELVLCNDNKSGYKQVYVEFFDGSKLRINLDKFNGGILYKDENYVISMPEFSHPSRDGISIEKVIISSQKNIGVEMKTVALLICSYFFDYYYTSSIG